MKILIVDDETIIREGIKSLIPWKECEIDEVRTCDSGEEAIRILPEYRPEVILCDIKMKKLSGFDVLEFVRNSLPSSKLIFLTGFDDFSFARRAVGMQAFDYILKTSSAEDLTAVILRAVNEIHREIQEQEGHEDMKRKLEHYVPLAMNEYMNMLVSGNPKPDTFEYPESDLHVNFDEGNFLVASIRPSFNKQEGDKTDRLWVQTKICVEETFTENQINFIGKNQDYVIIMAYPKQLEAVTDDFTRNLCRVAQGIYEATGEIVRIGISNIGDKSNQIPQLYRNAQYALGFSNQSSFPVISYDIACTVQRCEIQLTIAQEQKLTSSLRSGQLEDLESALDSVFYQFDCQNIISQQNVRDMCIMIFAMLSRIFYEFNLKVPYLPSDESFYKKIEEFNDYHNLKSYTYHELMKFAEIIANNHKVSAINVVDTARKYIDEHYAEDISLEKISSIVHLSPNHFSNLFSEKTGNSFLQYLTYLRLEKAKILLMNENYKTYEIGNLVGYPNPHYFSRIFKKYTGQSPIQYRELKMKG